MRESEKTNARRTADFIATYLTGRIIDIGSGSDPVTAHAECFDVGDGDANEILKFRPAQSYDCVYSSHCLEHMKHPLSALKQWWALVKPGGYLVLVVPHEDLYEQGYWPSLFNRDHKATFRISKSNATSWSPGSIDLHESVSLVPEAEVIPEEVRDDGYDYRLQGSGSRPHLGLVQPDESLMLEAPHADLHGQGYRPNLFNRHHRAAFRISKSNATSWSPVSIDLHESVSLLPELEIISEEIQDDGYDYRLQGSGRPHLGFLRRLATRLVSAGRTAHGFKQI